MTVLLPARSSGDDSNSLAELVVLLGWRAVRDAPRISWKRRLTVGWSFRWGCLDLVRLCCTQLCHRPRNSRSQLLVLRGYGLCCEVSHVTPVEVRR